ITPPTSPSSDDLEDLWSKDFIIDSLVANISLSGDAKWTDRVHTLLEKMDDLSLVCLSKSFLEDTKTDFGNIVRRGRELHELKRDCLPCPHLSKAIAVFNQLEEIIRSQNIGSFTVVRVISPVY